MSGSPRVTVPDRRHVAAWVAGDAAPHGEVSRYAYSSDEDDEWDSIGVGGVAACMMEEEALEAEDLEDQHFSFFDAGGLHGTSWNVADDRSLRSIGRATGAANPAVPAVPAPGPAPQPVATPKPAASSSGTTMSAAAVAAAAARVRVAAASSKVSTMDKDDSSNASQRRLNASSRGSKDLEERERRARAAEARLLEQAKQQEKDQANLAPVQAKAAQLRVAQQKQAVTIKQEEAVAQQNTSVPVAAATAATEARPASHAIGRREDELPPASTPPRRQAAAKRRPSRPPADSPLRTSTLESKFLELQQAVRATPPRKKSFATPQRHQTSARAKGERPANDIETLSASLDFERQVTAEAKEAWREASAEEAGWAKELQQVRAAIKAAEAEDEAVSERPRQPKVVEHGPGATAGGSVSSVSQSNAMHLRTAVSAAQPATRDEAALAGVKWSDVGTPAEILEKKLRKYRAKMNSPELTTAKRNEYLGKIRHYSAKAAELRLEHVVRAERSRASGVESSEPAMHKTACRSGAGGVSAAVGPSTSAKRAGQGHVRNAQAQRSALVIDSEDGSWKIGDRCYAGDPLGVGTVRFVGQCLELAKSKARGTGGAEPPLWAGVELDLPRGKHDGKVRGQRYFQCRPNCGVLLKLAKLQRLG